MKPTATPFLKQPLLLALLAALLCLGSTPRAAATTFRVNNTLTPNPAVRLYATLTTAQSAASATAGDTLLVEGSGTNYAAFTCTKRLTIIGPGYFLTQNGQSQANAIGASVEGIIFNPTSQGSVLTGITFPPGSGANKPYVSANSIAITRCYLYYGLAIEGSNINGILLSQNYFNQGGISVGSGSYSFYNVALKNNILASGISISQSQTNPRIFSVVDNNVFIGGVELEANSFSNNIIATPSALVSVTANNKLGNLITTAGQLPASGNTLVTTATSLFVGLAGAGNSTDGQYKLPTASPYLTAGTSNSQPGIFGGTEPYILSGVPAIPTIYSLRADAVGSKQGGLNVTIGARVNP